MHSRWAVLALLFMVRATMAFQFQSVAAVAPLLGHELSLGLADVGILIGLYFAPGTALALPGGAVGRRFGDKAAVLGGLVLMIGGGLIIAVSPSWGGQVTGRIIAGTGGVLLNVLLSKMVADWFAGREIATAMAIFVNSWPAGIAVSLLLLPAIGTAHGLPAVNLAVTGLIAVAFLAIAVLYQAPASAGGGPAASTWPDRRSMFAVILAGVIWALYNIGFATVFSFGPAMLAERGWSMANAGSTISIVLWLAVLSVPFGGFLADRVKGSSGILIVGCVAFAILLLTIPRSTTALPLFIVLGLVCGLPAGPIMSLPARVLAPATRALGMGLFFTVFYAGMLMGPSLGGRAALWAGTAAGAFDFGALALVLCPILLWVLHRLPRETAETVSASAR
jgi:predicted MFS family arabinose efflux permease